MTPNDQIKTWRERIGACLDGPLHASTDVERAMEAEIAELRSGLVEAAARNDELIDHQAGKAMDLAEVRTELVAASAEHETDILALHRRLAAETLRADQGWGRAEAKSKECAELRERMASMLSTNPGAQFANLAQGGPVITMTYNDLMILARRLIGEQLDDCDEEFLAGRAHGIGSLHSEILGLANESIARQVQEALKTAGAPESCRSSEKAQVESFHPGAGAAAEKAREQWAVDRDLVGTTVLDGAAAAPESRQSGTSPAPLPSPSDRTDADRSLQSEASDAKTSGQSVNSLVAMIVDRDTPPDPDGDEVVDWDFTGKPITLRMVRAFQCKGGANPAPPPVPQTLPQRRAAAELAEELLATLLWLYRRLPHGYGRQLVVEGPILALAMAVGIDVADCLAERGPAPSEGGTQ